MTGGDGDERARRVAEGLLSPSRSPRRLLAEQLWSPTRELQPSQLPAPGVAESSAALSRLLAHDIPGQLLAPQQQASRPSDDIPAARRSLWRAPAADPPPPLSAARSAPPPRHRARPRGRRAGGRSSESSESATTPRLNEMEAILDDFIAAPGCRALPSAIFAGRDPAPTEAELAALDNIGRLSRRVYVGGTQAPARRWAGCPETGMPGHRLRWAGMLVLAARRGAAGPAMEEALIRHARQATWRVKVENIADDARGLVGQRGVVNFLYVCYVGH